MWVQVSRRISHRQRHNSSQHWWVLLPSYRERHSHRWLRAYFPRKLSLQPIRTKRAVLGWQQQYLCPHHWLLPCLPGMSVWLHFRKPSHSESTQKRCTSLWERTSLIIQQCRNFVLLFVLHGKQTMGYVRSGTSQCGITTLAPLQQCSSAYWAVQYIPWLLLDLMPTGLVFSLSTFASLGGCLRHDMLTCWHGHQQQHQTLYCYWQVSSKRFDVQSWLVMTSVVSLC